MASTEETIANVMKCVRKGCLDPGLTLKESYTTDSIGPQTGLRAVHKLLGTGKCESLHRWVHGTVPLPDWAFVDFV